jgi:hypothetical protein
VIVRIDTPRNALRAYRVRAVAGALAVGVACTNPCDGPDCEAEFELGRVAVHQAREQSGSLRVWSDASAQFIGSAGDGTAWSVGSAGGLVIVGLPDDDRVVVTKAPAGDVALSSLASYAGDDAGARFGQHVAATSTDATGRWDLAVAAPDAALGRGAVYLFRSAHQLVGRSSAAADASLLGVSPGDGLGSLVVACGDVTGDGVPDWLVGAPRMSGPPDGPFSTEDVVFGDLAGAVFLVDGAAWGSGALDGDARSATRTWWGAPASGLGTAAVCDEDLDADGIDDLWIGAPWLGDDHAGGVYVVRGRPLADLPQSGLVSDIADALLVGPSPDAWFGYAVDAGDTDGDGAPELAVGAPGTEAGRGAGLLIAPNGSAYEVRASAGPPPDRAPGDHVGRAVLLADLDGRGGADFAVGAPDWITESAFDAGRVAVWFAERPDWAGTLYLQDDPHAVISGALPYQRVGTGLGAWDLDGDGAEELLLPTRAASD